MRAALIVLLLFFYPPVSALEDSFRTSSLGEDQPSPAESNGWGARALPRPEGGSELQEIIFSVAGQALSVKNGGVLALHPDSPFRVLSLHSDAWFDFNLHAELAGRPGVDLMGQAHTLATLLGENIYQREYIDLLALRGEKRLGGVRIMVRMLPIDWLRRAELSPELEERMSFLYKAYQLAPDDRLLALNLLDGLRRLGRLEQALDILRHYPGVEADADFLKQQGYIYQDLGRLDEAIAAFSAGLKLIPGDWDMSLALSALYESKQQWPEAALLLHELIGVHIAAQAPVAGEEAAANEKELAALMLRLARAYAQIPEKINDSLIVYEQYLLIAPADHLLWLEIAQLRAEAGQAEASLAARRRAFAAAPDNRDMIMQLQNALYQQGKLEEAAAVLREGLKQLPEEDILWLELMKIYRALQDNDSLIESYRQYIAIHPESSGLHYQLAQLLQAGGQSAAAMSSMETALSLRPDNADYLLGLMRLQIEAGQHEQALQLAPRLVAQNPAGLWPELYSLFGQSRPEALAQLLDTALSRAESPPKLYEMRAMLALNQNNPGQAARILAQGAENNPADTRLLYLLGGIYEGLNQDEQALPVYEKILRLDPEYEGVEQHYLQVKIRLLDKLGRNQ